MFDLTNGMKLGILMLIAGILGIWLATVIHKRQRRKLEFFTAKADKAVQGIKENANAIVGHLKEMSVTLLTDLIFERHMPVVSGMESHGLLTNGKWDVLRCDFTSELLSRSSELVVYHVRYLNTVAVNGMIPGTRLLVLRVLFTANEDKEYLKPITTGIPAEIVKRLLAIEYASMNINISHVDMDSIRVVSQQNYHHHTVDFEHNVKGLEKETLRIRTFIEREFCHSVVADSGEETLTPTTA